MFPILVTFYLVWNWARTQSASSEYKITDYNIFRSIFIYLRIEVDVLYMTYI